MRADVLSEGAAKDWRNRRDRRLIGRQAALAPTVLSFRVLPED